MMEASAQMIQRLDLAHKICDYHGQENGWNDGENRKSDNSTRELESTKNNEMEYLDLKIQF